MVLNTIKPTNQSTNSSISLIYHLFNFHNILVTGDDRGHNPVPVLDAFVETGKHVIDGTLRIFKAIINKKGW